MRRSMFDLQAQLQPEFAVGAEVDEVEARGVWFAVNQNKIGSDVAVAVISPAAPGRWSK